jgi:hypothetical protein
MDDFNIIIKKAAEYILDIQDVDQTTKLIILHSFLKFYENEHIFKQNCSILDKEIFRKGRVK